MFITRSEIENYFSTAKLKCLYCGRFFTLLGQHLRLSHDKTTDEYKDEFGLPRSRALITISQREKLSEKATVRNQLRGDDWKKAFMQKSREAEHKQWQKAKHHKPFFVNEVTERGKRSAADGKNVLAILNTEQGVCKCPKCGNSFITSKPISRWKKPPLCPLCRMERDKLVEKERNKRATEVRREFLNGR